MVDLSNRDMRQRDIIPPERLAEVRASVIGVGSVGRQVALQLAAVGVPTMTLIDPDVVAVENLAPQGFFADDVGRPKVHAVADLCHRSNPQLELYTEARRFRRSDTVGNCVFCCVDSIATRRLIWQAVGDRVAFFADGRMTAEVLRVIVASDPDSRRHYVSTLFDATEAHQGACTSKSTIFCSNICAGLMVGAFAKHLRGIPNDPDLHINLLANEWSLGAV
ncbi:MAG: ThiF family adenylyltransferase [Phycisphaerales bacterium]|nr:ThiF family adenylyltransferase [Phycisphaerales bacterium]